MANSISAVITTKGREYIARSLLDVNDAEYYPLVWSKFQIGTGGYEEDPVTGVRSPKAPNPTKTVLEDISPFEKGLIDANISFILPSSVQIECLVGTTEGNTPPNRVFWEIGIFANDQVGGGGNDHLIVYGTFPAQPKTNATALLHVARLIV